MINRIPGIWRVKRFTKSIKTKLGSNIVKLKKYDSSNNHYIFSDPRGGSTWLMEIIKEITNEPVVWEPLHLKIKNNPFNNINFGWRQNIPENVEWNQAKELFDGLFSGEILVDNVMQNSNLSEILKSKSLLFKICRGNSVLPWIIKNYSFKNKPIYMIRHPFAIANSQLNHGAWNFPYTKFNIPKTPYNENYKRHESFLKTLKTKEDALVANWCISNIDTLKHIENNKKWITIYYEDLVLNPEDTIDRIIKEWDLDYDLTLIDFEKNSKTTKNNTPSNKLKRLSAWQTSFKKDQIESMQNVLDYFNIDTYSKNNPLPERYEKEK